MARRRRRSELPRLKIFWKVTCPAAVLQCRFGLRVSYGTTRRRNLNSFKRYRGPPSSTRIVGPKTLNGPKTCKQLVGDDHVLVCVFDAYILLVLYYTITLINYGAVGDV